MQKLYLKKTTISLLCLFFLTTSLHAQPVIGLTPEISGLNFPIQMVNAGDGTKRIFIVHQSGSIFVYDEFFTFLNTFLTVSGMSTGGERGLLSMAFPPDYANPNPLIGGFFYVYYTNTGGNLEIARYHVSAGDPNSANATKTVVLTIPHPGQSNHNGGTIRFGNDGYLYLATGDGGGSDDMLNNAQNGMVMLGKMLRIAVNKSAVAPYYTVPTDNPFVAADDTLHEIWAFGLRNPFRWNFDKTTHDLWIGDVGQGAWEEIDYMPDGSTGGVNYGWRCYEAHANHNTSGCGPIANYIFPVSEYPNPGGAGGSSSAVTGGTVYRGTTVSANASLRGYYLAADYYSGDVYKVRPNGSGGWITYRQTGVRTGISDFGETENGEIYALAQGAAANSGGLYRITVTGTLPVVLVDFSAHANNGAVQLNWKTSSEQNIKQFEIEYSVNEINYTRTGIVQALNIPNGSDYTFSDNPSATGRIFYRLKLVDLDGRFEYSNVVSVEINKSDKDFVQPSIVTSGQLNVFLSKSFNTLELINMNGAVLLKQNIKGRTGRIVIPVPFVTTGTYVVQLTNDETTLRQRILIRQ
jgi:glucose/arabinose dehydrogenase